MKSKSLFTLTLLFIVTCSSYGQNDILLLKESGKVVIGDTSAINTNGNYKLYVQDGMLTEKVKVALKSTSDWSDNAFNLTPSLKDVSESIKKEEHLINMPSANYLVENGYDITNMDARLLAQIEWLWQYVIKTNDENKVLKQELQNLTSRIEKLEKGNE